MRIKARQSLERLRKMTTSKRHSVLFDVKHKDEWYECNINGGLKEYIKLLSWCNKNISKKYSRGEGAFWFEDKRDAFKFKLKWSNCNG